MASGPPSDQSINQLEVVEQMLLDMNVHDESNESDEEYYRHPEYESDQYDYDDQDDFQDGYFAREERRRAMDDEIQAEIDSENRWRVVEMNVNIRAERAEMQALEDFQDMIEDRDYQPFALINFAQDNRGAAPAATPVTAEVAKEGEDTCCVCMVNVPDCKFLECSHPGFICKVCADRIVNLKGDGKRCPLCRTGVTKYEVIQKPVEEEGTAEVPDSWEEL
jgi:hypothetical protein